MNVNLIVAYDYETKGIGKDGQIPWHNKEDLKFFKKVTIGNGNNAVVMGRKTYDSIGKPLPERLNIVLSKSTNNIDGCLVADTLEKAIDIAKENKIDELFIIGGGSVYKYALEHDLVDIAYINKIYNEQPLSYDTYFDMSYFTIYANKWKPADFLSKKFNMKYLTVYYRTNTLNNNDYNYLKLINDILTTGKTKHTRAGETLSLFPTTLNFDLREGLPILTTKKIYSKACIYELLWFLKGGDNIKFLLENNVHIWDDDAYRYYLELSKYNDRQLSKEDFLNAVLEEKTYAFKTNNERILKGYKAGDLGPVYGKQWTDWNGINQIDDLIYKLKNNPDDRRLMISAWNVGELKNMALPPCHYLSQWYVTNMSNVERINEYNKQYNKELEVNDDNIQYLDSINFPTQYLSCMWQQRSVDVCLGLPFDILSYSIFLSLVAQICNMIPYKLIANLGDTHIYKNQISNAIIQLKRNPYKYKPAKLELNKDIKNIYDFTYDDIKIKDYESYSPIKYILSVGL